MLLTTTESDVLTAAERLGDVLADAKTEATSEEYESVLLQCNQTLKQELGVDYGAVCSEDSCC